MRTQVASTAPNGVLGAAPVAAADLMHRAADAVRLEAAAISEQTGRFVREEPGATPQPPVEGAAAPEGGPRT